MAWPDFLWKRIFNLSFYQRNTEILRCTYLKPSSLTIWITFTLYLQTKKSSTIFLSWSNNWWWGVPVSTQMKGRKRFWDERKMRQGQSIDIQFAEGHLTRVTINDIEGRSVLPPLLWRKLSPIGTSTRWTTLEHRQSVTRVGPDLSWDHSSFIVKVWKCSRVLRPSLPTLSPCRTEPRHHNKRGEKKETEIFSSK